MHKSRVLVLVCLILCCSSVIFSQTKNATSFYRDGLEYQSDKDWWHASESFQQALKLNPDYADAWFELARCSYELNEFTLALQYLEKAEKYSAGRLEVLNLRGMTYISLGKLDEAAKEFNLVIQKYPNNVEARFGLAELNLFYGRITGAERLYQDALRLDSSNRKALLSLALVSAALGKNNVAKNYIEQAMQLHSNDEEVYYLASYFAANRGDLDEAERRARSAVQINGDFEQAYELLSSILFSKNEYQQVIDISDFLINRNRDNTKAWYLKGLALQKMNENEKAISTWTTGLEIDSQDEVMRNAFELLINETTQLEDPRRKTWAKYHIEKGKEFAKKYDGSRMRYEYQKALKIDPTNTEARRAFAELLSRDGYNELYLEQLKFIQSNSDTQNDVKLSDTIEGYNSLISGTLSAKWNISPFYLDKTRWRIGMYYQNTTSPILHTELNRITAETAATLFRGVSGTSVDVSTDSIADYGQAFRKAHTNNLDYFVILNTDETTRDIKIDVTMYSARTGSVVTEFTLYNTGNDKYSGALLRLRRNILDVLPLKGTILSRSGKDILIDIGKSENIVVDAVFKVIKKGAIKTAETGQGIQYNDKDVLGTLTLTKVSEEISEGVLSDTGFYDRVNSKDEVVLVSVPKPKEDNVASDTSPSATENSSTEQKKSALEGADLEINRTSSLIEMIRSIY